MWSIGFIKNDFIMQFDWVYYLFIIIIAFFLTYIFKFFDNAMPGTKATEPLLNIEKLYFMIQEKTIFMLFFSVLIMAGIILWLLYSHEMFGRTMVYVGSFGVLYILSRGQIFNKFIYRYIFILISLFIFM